MHTKKRFVALFLVLALMVTTFTTAFADDVIGQNGIDGSTSGITSSDETTPGDASSDGTSSDDTSSDNTSSDNTSSDDASSDDASSDGTSSDGTSSDGTSSDGTSSDGTSSDGTSSGDTSSDDASSGDTSSDDASSGDTSSDDASSDDTAAELSALATSPTTFAPLAPLDLENNYGESTLPDKWWLYQNFLEIRYPTMTEERYADIDVAEAKARGVGGISLYCAYEGKNTSYQFWDDEDFGTGTTYQTDDPGWFGCNPIDWFNPPEYNGTVQDLKDLADRLHANGMATGTYITHIFMNKDSVPYQKAMDPTDPEQELYKKLFAWLPNGEVIQHYNWGRPSAASDWNSATGPNTMNPVINFTNQAAIDYITNVQTYLARDIGVDYIEYDASHHYYSYPETPIQNQSQSTNPTSGGRNWRTPDEVYKTLAFDVPNTYRDVLTHDEGTRVNGIENRFDYGYTNAKMDEDIIQGIFAGEKTANDLDKMLRNERDYGASKGAVIGHFIECWLNPWENDVNEFGLNNYTDEQIALLYAAWAGVGVQVKYTYDIPQDPEAVAFGHMYSLYSDELKEMLSDIMVGMNSNPSQNPGGERIRVSIDGNPDEQYAVQRTSMDGNHKAINVFNFSGEEAEITLTNLNRTEIQKNRPLVDIISGDEYAAITSNSYTVTLPAYGFVMLQAQPAQPENGGNTESNSSSSGSSSSSSGGGGGSSTQTSAPVIKPLTSTESIGAVKTALAEAQATGASSLLVRQKNISTAPLSVLKEMAKAAGTKPVNFVADSMWGNAVDVRISFDPASATQDMTLSASTRSAKAVSTKMVFEKWYKNNVTALQMDHNGQFGTNVKVAAKLNLANFDTQQLCFYSYDRENNSFRRIANPNYFIDRNGYLHFFTPYGGSIIVSQGVLERK